MNECAAKEYIPDKDKLFYHISKGKFAPHYDFDDIPPHAFTPVEDGLSVNWEKYCRTAEECLNIKTERFPDGRTSQTHGVGHFIAGEARKIECLAVEYSPSMQNKAHSLIKGIPPSKPQEPYNQMRKKLKRTFRYWDIRPE
jgi:hypothetical protein